MNERITESIVRDHFKNDSLFKNIRKIEEQKSANPVIKKLLSTASKKGSGKIGFPEFIISFDDLPDFLIIIECKSDTTKHESLDKTKPVDYAVDGILHYAKFLQKDFSVIGIAVSGQNTKEIKVSNFFFKKNQSNYEEQKAKQLLSIYDYIKIAKDEENAIAIENLNITRTAIELNDLFQSYAIPEYERCTLVSAILLALQNDGFKKSYNEYSQLRKKNKNEEEEVIPNPKNLSEKIIDAVKTVLESNNIEEKRRDKILHEYRKILGYSLSINQKIKANKSKEEENNYIIRNIIHDRLEKEIYPLLKHGEKGYDVLGRFYKEFIRYAPSDQKTGLVLTPQHITEFFCDIAELSVSSVVFDPCCGTGGFLVSAMKDMLSKSNTSEEKRNIKQNQLIGMELRSDMFCFACTNMIMAGDGKSNIYQGNCFVEEDKKIITNLKPNVAFLNPPYDINEDGQLEFIENACDIIQNGTCVAIVQTSCATSSDKKALVVRERLFKKHTLKAVFSMPDELFSPVNATTCIIVFEAGKPHDTIKKTFFGYFKDDGFVKKKNKGRIDFNKKWNSIKEKWLKAYRNNDEIDGLSVKKEVNYNDEWCAEAYMQTDYSKLKEEDFIKTVRNFAGFKFLNNL